jgi:hypothetical protein
VRDYAFYNAGCTGPEWPRKVVIPLRRLLRRLLRPIFFRQAELFEHLGREIHELSATQRHLGEHVEAVVRRQDELDRRLRASLALGWDYVALVRRLAILEDRVNQLNPEIPADRSDPVSVLFPLVGDGASHAGGADDRLADRSGLANA